MKKIRCEGVGTIYAHGEIRAGVVKYLLFRDPRVDMVVCPYCFKRLKPGTLLGKILAYDWARLFSYVRYHKSAKV